MQADKCTSPSQPVTRQPHRDRPEVIRTKARLADCFLLAWVAILPVLLGLQMQSFRATGLWPARLGFLFALYGTGGALFLLRKRMGYELRLHILFLLALVFLVHHAFRVGPMAPPAMAVSLVIPQAAGLLLGIRIGWIYAWIISAVFFLGACMDAFGWIPSFPYTVDWKSRRVWDYWLSMAVGIPAVCGFFLIPARRLFRAWEKVAADLETATEESIQLQERLLRAQQLESIGRLAGGVAHDMNNMISVVLSQTDLIELELQPDDPLREKLEDIRQMGLRSSSLAHQLLFFARQQPNKPKAVDLNAWIQETRGLLEPLLGIAIQMRFKPGEGIGKVSMDPTHLDQILLNLLVNARDAMPGGGLLTVETAKVRITEEGCHLRPGMIPGGYVQLTINDQGTGMDPETLNHIFEPYFTTKEPGKGTGLGLATVHGIVQQAGGFIEVQSQPSAGTTFRLFLPACADPG